MLKRSFMFFLFFLSSSLNSAFGQVVINEILYHAPSNDLEYIELFNSGDTAIDLSYWVIKDNQDSNRFVIPSGNTIDAGGYVVLANDFSLFQQQYGFPPAASGIPFNFSNREDAVRLFDANGQSIEAVSYHDRAPWPKAADGNGSSLERINADIPAHFPEAWGASTQDGTPGAINSIRVDRVAPLIFDVNHSPRIPAPNQAVTITARPVDIANSIQSVKLYYGHNRGLRYESMEMRDDGRHGDGEAQDGIYGAKISGERARTILRFYIEATNSKDLISHMPEQGGEQPYMTVFESARNENVAFHRVVMRPEVHQRFLDRYRTDDYFPATFYDGDEVYYQVDIRHRGRSRSKNGRFKIRFPYDNLYRGKIRRLNYNGTKTSTILREYISYQLYQDAGLPNMETSLVRLHINGQSTKGTPYRVCIENPDAQFLRRRHFFKNDNGNLYKTTLDGTPQNKATWRYVGDDADLYRDCYIKQTNEDEDDFTDIIEFCQVLSQAEQDDPDYAAKVRSVLNIDTFIRWMAVSAVVSHWDSPYTDHGHNYVLYHDPATSQFSILAWDLNGTFQYSSNHNSLNYRKHYTHIRSTKFHAINKILNHPEFGAQYYRDIDLLLKTLYTPISMNERIEEAQQAIKASRGSTSFLRSYVPQRIRDLSEWIHREEGMAFLSKPVYQAYVSEPYRYPIVAVDYRRGLPVSYQKIYGPNWLNLNKKTGELTGIPPREGDYVIEIQAQNAEEISVTQNFQLQVIDSRPRLILPFNQQTKTKDLGPYKNHAQLKGRARLAQGRLGQALYLNGSSDYAEVSHDESLDLTGSITVEAWIRPSHTSNPQVILTKGDKENFNYSFILGYGPFNTNAKEPCFQPHRFDIQNRAYYGRKEIEARLRAQEWVHLAGTYDSGSERVGVYVNNRWIVDSSARPQMVKNNRPLQIGMNSGSGFRGWIDDIKILPFAKKAFAAGLCLSQVDISGLSPAQDRVALSLTKERDKPVRTEKFCLHLARSNQWLPLPQGELAPGESVMWWLDDLGLKQPIKKSEILALYPMHGMGHPSREWILDQVVWGDIQVDASDPGVQSAIWLPGRTVAIDRSTPSTLVLNQFADNDEMDEDWAVKDQILEGPSILSFGLANGTNQTTQRNVRLQIETPNTNPPKHMRLSNSPVFREEWIRFSNNVEWNLPSGKGTKTVYLQVADSRMNRSQVIATKIQLVENTDVINWRFHQ